MTFEQNQTFSAPRQVRAPSGGYAAILGLAVGAVAVMGLLAFGYNTREASQTSQNVTVPKAASASDQMSSPTQPHPNGVKTTTSTTGVGSSNGSN